MTRPRRIRRPPPSGPRRPRSPTRPEATYARLSCPDAVVAEQPFDLVVGLAEHPDIRVVGQALLRPPSSVGAYTMTIQLVADGLRLADAAASWRIDLAVTADAPYPFVTLQLIPDAQEAPSGRRRSARCTPIDGNPIGLAVRSVALVRSAELLTTAPAQPPAHGVDLSLPAGHVAPDLTVRIERAESQASGRLLLQLLDGRSVDRHARRPDPHRHRRRSGRRPATHRRRDARGRGSPDAVRRPCAGSASPSPSSSRSSSGTRLSRIAARIGPAAAVDPVPLGRAIRPVGARGRGPSARSRPTAVPRCPGDGRTLGPRPATARPYRRR